MCHKTVSRSGQMVIVPTPGWRMGLCLRENGDIVRGSLVNHSLNGPRCQKLPGNVGRTGNCV